MLSPLLMFTHFVCLCANFSVILAKLSHMFVPLPPPQQVLLREISPARVFSPSTVWVGAIQLCMCRLITPPGDQWAHPGIVLLRVFDGVSLQAMGWIALCFFRHNLERGGVSGKSQWQPSGGYDLCYKIVLWVVNTLIQAFVTKYYSVCHYTMNM